MDSETGEIMSSRINFRTVQLDLYDRRANWLYDSKVGARGMDKEAIAEAEKQAGLIKNGFLEGATWVGVPNSAGSVGFSRNLFWALDAKGINVRYID